MIIETVITTENQDGTMHVSAIGPHVNEALTQWELKPFTTSTTFQNLRRTGRCVIHVIDDALLLAQIVTRQNVVHEATFDSAVGFILNNTCQAYGLQVMHWQLEEPRSTAIANQVWQKLCRPFWGWNRAKHGLLELAIDATRIDFLPALEIEASVQLAQRLVAKTGGEKEHLAFDLLKDFVLGQLAAKAKKR